MSRVMSKRNSAALWICAISMVVLFINSLFFWAESPNLFYESGCEKTATSLHLKLSALIPKEFQDASTQNGRLSQTAACYNEGEDWLIYTSTSSLTIQRVTQLQSLMSNSLGWKIEEFKTHDADLRKYFSSHERCLSIVIDSKTYFATISNYYAGTGKVTVLAVSGPKTLKLFSACPADAWLPDEKSCVVGLFVFPSENQRPLHFQTSHEVPYAHALKKSTHL